jgi:hypothetical protein
MKKMENVSSIISPSLSPPPFIIRTKGKWGEREKENKLTLLHPK